MITTITRKIEFDSGHRVLGHEGKCAHLHGHRYVAEVDVQATNLDNIGRVIDFGVMKTLIGGWVDDHWDHNLLLHRDDPLLVALTQCDPALAELVVAGKEPYIMRTGNPTAENIAEELFDRCIELLHGSGIEVVAVTIHETPNCRAVFRKPEANHIHGYKEVRNAKHTTS